MPPVTPTSSRVSRKRHLQDDDSRQDSKKRRVPVIDLTGDSDNNNNNHGSTSTPVSQRKSSKKTHTTPPSSSKKSTEERRLRRFRTHPPQAYYDKLHRATTQRMFVIGRTRVDTGHALEERVDMVGTVGNIYTVTISLQPSCTCPDALKGNQCKHIIYVLVNVLKVREDLRYQLAFLSSELQEMFDNAPLETKDTSSSSSSSDKESDGKRKPIDGECPICYMEFEPKTEQIIWCETSCGNNIHKACFDKWAAASRENGVRCVYCRAEWPTTNPRDLDMKSLMSNAEYSEDGYLNVASAVGLSGERDYSTYNRFWRRRHLGRSYGSYYGYGYDDDDFY